MVCEAIKEEKEEKLYVFYEMKNSIMNGRTEIRTQRKYEHKRT